jgi:alpha-L-fucosidase
LQWPGSQLTLKTIQPQKDTEILLLGNKKPLKWEINPAKELVISIPENIRKVMHQDEQLAFTFKIENPL